jgi:hypothetical protein
MDRVQTEHKEWLNVLYPGQNKMYPLVGIVEESAELLHALLKREQGHVWGAEERYIGRDWRAAMVDAVADCAIYMCSYCNTVGWDFAALVRSEQRYQTVVCAMDRGLKLVRLATDFVSDDTWERAVLYIVELRALSVDLGIDIEDAVRTTWAEVKMRRR